MIYLARSRGSGWWNTLACLPLAVVLQVMFLTVLCHEAVVMGIAAQWMDLAILLRCIIGLLWQPRSRDWPIYIAFQFALIPLCWLYFLLCDRIMPFRG